MYAIESAYGLKSAPGSKWQEINVSEMTGFQAYTLMDGLYLTLSTPLLDHAVTVNMKDLQVILGQDTRKLSEIFSEWDDPTPLKESELPSYRSAQVIYTDALRADYIPQKSIPGGHYTSGQDNLLKTELQLTREGTDMRRLERYALISCNGLLYRVEASQDVAYVPEAGKSLLRSGLNHIGLLSFETIGEIKTYPIAPTVEPHTAGTSISGGASIELPDVDLTNKSLLLVLGGYLHFPFTGVFSPVSNTRVLVRMQLLELVERYKETMDRMDWSEIIDDDNPSEIWLDGASFFTDDAMRAYFAHPQSFWVVVDTPRITASKKPLQALPFPGNYLHGKEPTEALITGNGLLVDYWKTPDINEWGIYAAKMQGGKSVNTTVGRDLWSGRFSMGNLPGAVIPNKQVSLLSIIANQIPVEPAPVA